MLMADPRVDLALAADGERTEADRMAAFARLVALGSVDTGLIKSVSADPAADTTERWVSIRVLGQIGGNPAREVLPMLAVDPNPAIRSAALSAIGDCGFDDFVDLVAKQLRDESILVRAAAADALGVLGSKRGAKPLIEALEATDSHYRGESLWVRHHYVKALGHIGSKVAYPALLRTLSDEDPQVQQAALVSLELIGGFSFAEGRSPDQEREAWRRWLQTQISAGH